MARSSVYINGKQIVVEGDSAASISVINGKVTINGKVVEENATGTVELKIDGPVASVTCDGNVVRRRVFCASLSDVFEDRKDLDVPRARLFALVRQTPWLDWLLLTKRPEHRASSTGSSSAARAARTRGRSASSGLASPSSSARPRACRSS